MSSKGKMEKNGIRGEASNSASQDTPSDIFERNLQAFIEYACERGAEVIDEKYLVYRGVTLTNDIAGEVEDACGDEVPIDPQELWHDLIFMTNLYAWWKYVEEKGATYDEDGRLVFNGKKLPGGPEYLKEQDDEVDERLITEEEFEALWKNLIDEKIDKHRPLGRGGGQ